MRLLFLYMRMTILSREGMCLDDMESFILEKTPGTRYQYHLVGYKGEIHCVSLIFSKSKTCPLQFQHWSKWERSCMQQTLSQFSGCPKRPHRILKFSNCKFVCTLSFCLSRTRSCFQRQEWWLIFTCKVLSAIPPLARDFCLFLMLILILRLSKASASDFEI